MKLKESHDFKTLFFVVTDFFFTSALFCNPSISHISFMIHYCCMRSWLGFFTSTHAHMWVGILESFSLVCTPFFFWFVFWKGVLGEVCMPFKSTRDFRERNFLPQHQRYFFSSVFMCMHYINQIYRSSHCYNVTYIKAKGKYFLLKLK